MEKEYIKREAFREYVINSEGVPMQKCFAILCAFNTPAADVVEVRHGKWREEKEYYDDDYSECNVRKVYACSLCGRTEKQKEPYCNCGAKMDGGNKDG